MNDSDFEGLITPHSTDEIYEEARKKALRESEADFLFGSWHLYLVVFIVLVVNIGALVYVYQRQKRRVSSQMNSSVQSAVS